jgi:hypothetical protein
MNLELDPRLVEEAVFLYIRERSLANPATREWHREREALYVASRGADRERAFRELASRWFGRLGLACPIERAIGMCPGVRAGLSSIHLRGVVRARDEGSELFAAAGSPRPDRMILALEPRRFLAPVELEDFALCELLHAEDILDPAFGFDPVFDPDPELGHARRELLRDRFHVLWEARVAGRMARRAGPSAPSTATPHFRRAFGSEADPLEVDARFLDAWSGRLCTHRALLVAAHGS